jgi:hypothetical protein
MKRGGEHLSFFLKELKIHKTPQRHRQTHNPTRQTSAQEKHKKKLLSRPHPPEGSGQTRKQKKEEKKPKETANSPSPARVVAKSCVARMPSEKIINGQVIAQSMCRM